MEGGHALLFGPVRKFFFVFFLLAESLAILPGATLQLHLVGWWLLSPARAAGRRASPTRSTMISCRRRQRRPRGDYRQSAKGLWLGECDATAAEDQ